MIITVASGKGGTGKTTVAVNLALSIGKTQVLDCDVEEPNSHTLLHPSDITSVIVTAPVPVIDSDKCTLCGKCAEFCQYNALFVGKKGVMVFEKLCHSCGGCALVCPEGAITEEERPLGDIHRSQIGPIKLVYGELRIGEPIATSVIRAVKGYIDPSAVNVLDAPPGTACPVVETMSDSDYLILVTEPTPFGLHDLSMTVDVVRTLGIPFGVVINRANIGDDGVEVYCRENGIPILLEIPFDRRIAELYSSGVPFVQEMPEWRDRFRELYEEIRRIVDGSR
ncbi:MAG: ATP-binding protein [Candidatus Thorarchaeota archaeon]|nr:MAG: (4Fe-4S)-binding protein [Candidatus Thorarchaeota archaeon]RLI59731.1 MAG: (4Fe-4S)-binding protein [Candidatus Thorarchaeota archaeon]